ncbi:hypothetical protein OG407_06200 [Streptomyces sp. NBC_01515]
MDDRAHQTGGARQFAPVPFDGEPGGVVGVHGADDDGDAGLLGGLGDPPGLLDAGGERLLDQDRLLAGRAGSLRLRRVELVRAAHRDDVDGRVGEQFLDGGAVRGTGAGGDGLGGTGVDVRPAARTLPRP